MIENTVKIEVTSTNRQETHFFFSKEKQRKKERGNGRKSRRVWTL